MDMNISVQVFQAQVTNKFNRNFRKAERQNNYSRNLIHDFTRYGVCKRRAGDNTVIDSNSFYMSASSGILPVKQLHTIA